MATCGSCGWAVNQCVCQKKAISPRGAPGAARSMTTMRSSSSPSIVRNNAKMMPAASPPQVVSHSPPPPFTLPDMRRQSSSVLIPKSMSAPPSAMPLSSSAPPVAASAERGGTLRASVPAISASMVLSMELFAPVCTQLGLCARREGPQTALRDAPARLAAAGRQGWAAVVAVCAYQDCIDVLAQLLRGIEGGLVTAECVKWFLDTELVQDDEHRFQLFFSLLHCLPPQNRSYVMLLSEGLAGFPSVAALSLGPMLLGLHPALPSGQSFVKFLVALPSRAILMDPVEGSWFGPGNGAGCFAVGSCAASRVVSLLADPYYCGVLDPSFPVLVADMYMYFFSSPELLLLALGEQLRRFMRPGAWAAEARWRLVMATQLLAERWQASAFSPSQAWRKNWTWLLQLLTHPACVGGDDVLPAFREAVRGLTQAVFHDAPSSPPPPPPAAAGAFTEAGHMETPLEEQSPKAAARALRRLFLEAFEGLALSHLVKQRWMTAALSPPFARLVTMFNGLQGWAVSWVLEAPKPKDRGSRLAWLARCAVRCRKLNNLHAAMALFLACSDPAIARLSKSMAYLPSKAQAHLADLRLLADPKNNHQVYNAALKNASSNPPVIPYLALSSKYLFSMGDANPDVIEASGFLNVNKFRMIQNFITSLLELKAGTASVLSQPLNPSEAALASFLSVCCSGSYDNQAMYALSLEMEPRESE